MRAVGLFRLRAWALAAGACALAAGVAGCGSTSAGSNNEAVTVSGAALTVWAAQPPASAGQAASDTLEAEELAFSQAAASKIDGYTVRLRLARGNEVSAEAREAISDKTAIAYLGQIEPGTSGVSLQITNELGLLQVSPTDTAAYLTRTVPGVADSPGTFYPAHSDFGATFARVVPTTLAEARAIVARMRSRGVSRLGIVSDGTPYGIAVASEVRSDAAASGISVSSGDTGSPGAVLVAGEPDGATRTALDAAASADPSAALFGPSALYDSSFVSGLSAAAQSHLTVSSPGFPTASLNALGRQFVQRFSDEFHHAPAPQAIFGYAAMQAVLLSLREAGQHAAVRQTVARDMRGLHVPASASPIGAYSLSGGDTGIAPFVFATVSHGALVPRSAG